MCIMFLSVTDIASAEVRISFIVRWHSSSWPVEILCATISLTRSSIRWAVGFSRERDAASTESAMLSRPISFVCGFGPG